MGSKLHFDAPPSNAVTKKKNGSINNIYYFNYTFQYENVGMHDFEWKMDDFALCFNFCRSKILKNHRVHLPGHLHTTNEKFWKFLKKLQFWKSEIYL